MPAAKRKIVVLGGGVGAMSAAYHLTNRDGWSDQYEVTVYQMGWRLGGKGASGRNRKMCDRIEEHGLHMWMGFYQNAWRMIEGVYAGCAAKNLLPGSPLQTWRDAFKPQSAISLGERVGQDWAVWTGNWPVDATANPADGPLEKGPWHYVVCLLDWMASQWESAAARSGGVIGEAEHDVGWLLKRIGMDVESSCASLLHLLSAVARHLPADPFAHTGVQHETLLALLDRAKAHVEKSIAAKIEGDSFWRHLQKGLSLAFAVIRGVIADRVIINGFDSIDGYKLNDWVARHGGDPDSDLVRSFADSAFAYEDGDPLKPNWAAGTGLRAVLRLVFDRPGAVMWKMQAGMGDTIFAPLYKLLCDRGVRFEFFHFVEDIVPAADGNSISEIHLLRQVALTGGSYPPLFAPNGVPSWPSEPFWEQLQDGAVLESRGVNFESYWDQPRWPGQRLTLKAGEDFDSVVMGISLGAIPYAAASVVKTNKRWQDMAAHVKTVETQAFQIWANRTSASLGWQNSGPNPDQVAMISGYVEPYDTWADMSHLIPRESWPAGLVQNISYYCNALPSGPVDLTDPTVPTRETLQARENARRFLASSARLFWPGFDSDALVNGFDAQFFRANYEPSERFVLSLAGSLEYRIPSADSGYSNMTLAGDWTRNGLNTGCVEAAVMSGMQAARAICGSPETIIGETDF